MSSESVHLIAFILMLINNINLICVINNLITYTISTIKSWMFSLTDCIMYVAL